MSNIVLKDGHANLLKPFQLILNHKVVSYYLSKLIFSDTTETARHLDNPYVVPIPIPKELDFSVVSEIVDILFFVNQYYFKNYLSKEQSDDAMNDMISYFNRVASALSYELFFQKKLESNLQKILKTQVFEKNERWDSLEKVRRLYNRLLKDKEIKTVINTIHSHIYVKRIAEN